MKKELGRYSVVALNTEIIANYRDKRIEEGKSATTIRLEVALLSHLFTIAIQEWRLRLVANPVLNVRKPSPAEGRNRRLVGDEEDRLLKAFDQHSNPFLGWIVGIAVKLRAIADKFHYWGIIKLLI